MSTTTENILVQDSRRRRMMGSDRIIMTTESNPVVLAKCFAQGWCAHEDYMTMAEAAKVTNIARVFRTGGLTQFDELRFFIGTVFNNQSFYSNQSCIAITFPKNATSLAAYCFASVGKAGQEPRIIFGEKLTAISGNNVWGTYSRIFICKAKTPPTVSHTSNDTGWPYTTVYVPDNSITAYQNANWWQDAAAILPISQCPREYGEYKGLIKGNALDE